MNTATRPFVSRTLLTVVMILCISPGHAQVDPQSMVGAWLLDEGTGNLAQDASGHGYDADFRDSPTWTEGVRGTGLAFQNGSYLEIRDSSETLGFGGSATFSVTAWVKNQGGGTVMGKYNAGVIGAFFLQVDSGGIIGFDRESAPWIMYGTQALPSDDFAHVAVTYDGTTLKIYVNGDVDVQQDWGPQNPDTVTPVLIGARHAAGSPTEFFNGVLDEVALFDVALTQDDIREVMNGLPLEVKASAPVPGDKSTDVFRDTLLSWTPVEGPVTHDVYLGMSFEDVDTATVPDASGLDDSTYDPGRLDLGTTYYWRVDEVNSPPDNTVFKGSIWSFTTEPVAYEIENVTATASSDHAADQGAERTVDASGLNASDEHSSDLTDMWLSHVAETEGVWIQYDLGTVHKLDHVHVWNHNSQTEMVLGYGIKEALVEVSSDGETWTDLKTVEIPQAPAVEGYAGVDVTLDGAVAQYVRITALSNYSILGLRQFGLSEVRFYSIPVLARMPVPADNSICDDANVMLQWRPGREAAQHEVVFSDDMQAVVDGTAVIDTVSAASLDLGTLNLGNTYYWKINETNEVGTPPVHEGDLWTFRTPEHIMVEDFERYTSQEGLRLWEHWLDGFEDPASNGAVVGNGDNAETSVVYEGSQSMPVAFDNTTASRSEATRTFDTPVDLTRGHPESLKVQIRGDAPGFVDNGDGTLTVGAAGADIWNTLDDFRFVYKRLSGDGSITVKINSAIDVHEWVKAGVMIRENLAPNAANAFSFVTPRGRVGTQWRAEDFGTTDSTRSQNNGMIALPYWVRLTRTGRVFKGEQSADGVTWMPMIREDNPTDPTEREILMIPDVYIGLAVTSHVTGTPTIAELSDVTTTGSVTGPWIAEAIGADTHPDNQAAPMYLIVADTTGKAKRIDHPNPAATVMTHWDEWTIPLDDLSPVNVSEIDSITVGVGSSGVQGRVFVDAIRTAKPYPAPTPTE